MKIYRSDQMESGIYKITSPSGRVYIGQSVNITYRFGCYRKLKNCKEQRLLYNSFLKYGVENHSFEVIEYCDSAVLNVREIFFIDLFCCLDKSKGMNLRNGGVNGAHSEETKIKISKANTGKKLSEERRRNMSNRMRKNPIKYWLGKKRSAEDINKFRISHLGLVNSNKPIIQYDLNMTEIARFNGATDAFRKTGIKRTAIKNNLTGRSKTCNKTIFKYATN